MTRSGTFGYMRYASAVGLLPWECEMGSSHTAFSIVTSRRSARNAKNKERIVFRTNYCLENEKHGRP